MDGSGGSTTPGEVRKPIEARWHAFGQGAPFSGRTSEVVIRIGDAMTFKAPGYLIMLALPFVAVLVVLSNAAGYRETSSQREARELREPLGQRRREDLARARRDSERHRQQMEGSERNMEEMRRMSDGRFPFSTPRPPAED